MSTTTRSSQGSARASEAANEKRSESGAPLSVSKVLMEPALMATSDVSVMTSRSTGVPGPAENASRPAVVGLVLEARLEIRGVQAEEAAGRVGEVEGVAALVDGQGRGGDGQLLTRASLARS